MNTLPNEISLKVLYFALRHHGIESRIYHVLQMKLISKKYNYLLSTASDLAYCCFGSSTVEYRNIIEKYKLKSNAKTLNFLLEKLVFETNCPQFLIDDYAGLFKGINLTTVSFKEQKQDLIPKSVEKSEHDRQVETDFIKPYKDNLYELANSIPELSKFAQLALEAKTYTETRNLFNRIHIFSQMRKIEISKSSHFIFCSEYYLSKTFRTCRS